MKFFPFYYVKRLIKSRYEILSIMQYFNIFISYNQFWQWIFHFLLKVKNFINYFYFVIFIIILFFYFILHEYFFFQYHIQTHTLSNILILVRTAINEKKFNFHVCISIYRDSLIFVSLLRDTSIRSNFQHGHYPWKIAEINLIRFPLKFQVMNSTLATPIKLRRYGSSSCVT